jgi:ParB family chromosome partitioning protein
MSKLERFKTMAHHAFIPIPDEDRSESLEVLTKPRLSGRLQGTERLEGVRLIPIERIVTDSQQPRKTFSEKSLHELAASIRSHGIIQPLTVEYDSTQDVFKIVTGERRYRAAHLAGLKQLPCIINQNLEAEDRLYYQLIENLQREDISAFEEAEAFKLLSDRFRLKQEEIANVVGKSRPYVTKAIGLTRIPMDVRHLCNQRGINSREQLILLAQQKTEQAMISLLDAMDQQGKDVRTVRRLVDPNRSSQAKRFVFHHQGSGYTVKIAFTKQKVSKQEIANALRGALNSLTRL